MAKTRNADSAFELTAGAEDSIRRAKSTKASVAPEEAPKTGNGVVAGKTKGFCVRLPPELHRALEWHRFATGESMNDTFLRVLRKDAETWEIPESIAKLDQD